MSIYTKKPKQQIINQDDTFDEPITLGNAYNVHHKLNTQIDINKNQLNQLHTINQNIENQTRELKYEFWMILQLHANYFQNLYAFELVENNPQLFDKILKCFRYQWLYGNCGIYKLSDKYIAVYEIKAENDGNGELKKIHLGLLNYMISGNEIMDINAGETWKVIDGNDENYARLIGSTNGMGAVITWLPFIKQQTSLLKKIYTLSYILNKKLIYKIHDQAFVNDEIKLFLNDDTPIIFKLDGITGNIFTTDNIDGLGDGVDSAIQYYDFFIKIYYELLGRRMNVDYKMERNVAAEVDSSQHNFNILEFELISKRKMFLNKLSELGVSWKELTDVIDRDNESGSVESDSGNDKNQLS